jgi:hypothetical protein
MVFSRYITPHPTLHILHGLTELLNQKQNAQVTICKWVQIPLNHSEQNHTCDADGHSASQKFPPFMEPKGFLMCSQEPTTGSYPKQRIL